MTTSRGENPCKQLEQAVKDMPEWIEMAREVLSRWEAGKVFLLPVVAQGLKEAYERGQASNPPAAAEEEEHVTVRVRRRR